MGEDDGHGGFPGGRSLIEVGRVGRSHGVRGHVRVRLYNPASDALDRCPEVWVGVGKPAHACAVEVVSRAGELLVVRVDGVDDRTAAEALKGAGLWVPREAVGELGEDEYLVADLLGCEVRDEAGRTVGRVADVMSTGSCDVLVVRDQRREILVPLLDPWVGGVDPAARRISLHDAQVWEDLATGVEDDAE